MRRRVRVLPMRLRSGNSAAKFDRNADVRHRHFRAGNGAGQHELVEIADVSDTKYLACDLGEAGTKREVVAAVGRLDYLCSVEGRRHHDGADGI